MKAIRNRKNIGIKRCIFATTIAAALIVPAQATADSCNAFAEVSVQNATYFEKDIVPVKIKIGAGLVDPLGNITIQKFSYYPDCQAGGDIDNCINQPNLVNFVGITSNNCETLTGDPVVWTVLESGEIVFQAGALGADSGDAVVAANADGSSAFCTVDIEVELALLDPTPASPNTFVFGAAGFRAADAACDNGIPAGNDGGVAIRTASCSIDLEKQVSVTGGAPFFDADTSPGLNLEYPPGNALFQLLVTNNGSADYVEPITIVDPDLGINTTIPALAAGASATVSASGTPPLIPELAAPGWCTTPGPKENTSEATGVCRSGDLVDASDNNNAWVNCVPPPSIDIVKEISLNGVDGWFDANTAGSGPTTEYDSDAYYRLRVTNDGLVDLVNVTVEDTTLGVGPVNIGALAASAFVVLESGTPDFGGLYAVDRCTSAGDFDNTATADGESAITGSAAPQASDPAWLRCVEPPSIDIVKEISLNGVDGWLDANTAGSGPTTEYDSDAYYRLRVTNDGLVDLVNVTVEDTTLGVGPVNIGALAASAFVVLESGTPDFGGLYAVDRCTSAGDFDNTATADGESAITGLAVPQASDPAWLRCVEPPSIDIVKEISLNGVDGWLDANTAAAGAMAVPPSDAYYRLRVTNDGLVDLVNVTVEDTTLGVGPVNIGALAASAFVVLESGTPDFGGLYAVDRCTVDGEYENTATADGESALTGLPAPQASDPAWLVCDSPGMAICRTPGFWGARGGDALDDDYKHGFNYTLEFLGDGVEVCGQLITNTDLESSASAIEAICINKGDPMAKYIRMATSAALNCNLADCGDIEGVLAACNATCALGGDNDDALNACAAELGCFNEGGTYVDGMCMFYGQCYSDPDGPIGSGDACAFDSDRDDADTVVDCVEDGEFCYRQETCHDRDLCPDGGDYCYEDLGPASSPKKCSQARKNGDYIFDFPGWGD